MDDTILVERTRRFLNLPPGTSPPESVTRLMLERDKAVECCVRARIGAPYLRALRDLERATKRLADLVRPPKRHGDVRCR